MVETVSNRLNYNIDKKRKMKKVIISVCTVICFISVKASPQAPDYLIIGKDTLPVYQLILEDYFQTLEQPTDSNSLFGFSFREIFGGGFSFNCWRGYQAVYCLDNDSLFLKYILPCNSLKNINSYIESSKEKMKLIFDDKVKNDRVLLDWYSGEFTIPKGKPIWWDGIFTRIYDKEELYTFQNGILLEKTLVNNYQKVKGGIARDDKAIAKKIFNRLKKINWKKLYKQDIMCDLQGYHFTIDERGKISSVESGWENLDEEDLYCLEIVKKQVQNLQFDIIKYHGRPMAMQIFLKIFYDDEKHKLEMW